MARKASPNNPPCPFCQSKRVTRNGLKNGRQRWLCHTCRKTFGPTYGTPLYGLRTSTTEIAYSLLVVMRRGSLNSAEEITGHKYETLGRWLRQAPAYAAALTDALTHDLHLTASEVAAFWSFVHQSIAYGSYKTVFAERT